MDEVLPCYSVTNLFTLITHLGENTDGTAKGNWGLFGKQCIKNITNSVTFVYSLLCDANTIQSLCLMKRAEHLAFCRW